MPCYCDSPSEANQVEIEKRCKIQMYFEAASLLNEENLKKAEEMGIKICQVPLPDENTALCNICKVLTNQQMYNINARYYQIKWKHQTLLDWYIQHQKDDLVHNHSEDK